MAAGRRAEDRHQRRLAELGHIGDGRDPAAVELARGGLPDPPQQLDRPWVEKAELAIRRHHEQTVRLRLPAGYLGEELRAGDPDSDRQADPRPDLAAQPDGDLRRRPGDLPEPGDVEERLVDRQPLDQRRCLLEYLEDRFAGLRVGRHPRVDDHRLRTQPASLAAAHGGANTHRLRLVAGGEHDPRPDDDRSPAQPGVVALLDRGVERVEVRVQDRRVTGHEHMFASGSDNYTRRLKAQTDSGANTRAIAPAHARDWMIRVASGPVTIRPRDASARIETGFALTNGCSQLGIVSAGTNTLLTNVTGNNAVNPNSCTFSGSLATTPTSTDTQENAKANTKIKPTAARSDGTLVPIRKPRIIPTASNRNIDHACLT